MIALRKSTTVVRGLESSVVIRSVILVCQLFVWHPGRLAAEEQLPDEVYRVDMDMQEYLFAESSGDHNWADAMLWAYQKTDAKVADWKRAYPEGKVVVLAHSAGSWAADYIVTGHVPVDKVVIWSNGVPLREFAADLRSAGITRDNALVVSSAGDLVVPWAPYVQVPPGFWPSREYPDSPYANTAYHSLHINDVTFGHSEMVTWGEVSAPLKGTLPGLSQTQTMQGAANEYVRNFLLNGVSPGTPMLVIDIAGTEWGGQTGYEQGKAGPAMETLIGQQVLFRLTGQLVAVTTPSNQQEDEAAGWTPGQWIPSPGHGVDSGRNGGIESFPLLAPRAALALDPADMQVEDLMPDNGPPGTTATTVVAPYAEYWMGYRARARDYTSGTEVRATIFGVETQDATYPHSKQVCDRFHGGSLLDVQVVNLWDHLIPGDWYYLVVQNGPFVEHCLTFSVALRDGVLHFDSRYLPDY